MIYASMGDNDQAMHWLEERTKNDLIRAFYCGLASILSARTRALKSLCAVSACPSETIRFQSGDPGWLVQRLHSGPQRPS